MAPGEGHPLMPAKGGEYLVDYLEALARRLGHDVQDGPVVRQPEPFRPEESDLAWMCEREPGEEG